MQRTTKRWWPLVAAWALAISGAPALAKKPELPGDGWQRVTPTGPVIGADGKSHTAMCSGYPGTVPTYHFWTRTSSTSKNLVVFFEGGGACWDNFTCTFPIAGLPPQVPQFFVPSIDPATDPASYDGIFRSDRADNPVRDWNMVYIPYCTGDLHVGSTAKQYYNAGHPVFTLPSPFTLQHRGFDNFMVVLDWMKKNIDKPKEILVTGSSAGGYGATANFPWVQESFRNAHVSVIADASQGVSTANFDASEPGRNSWNPQLAPWVFGASPPTLRSANLLRAGAAAYPHTKVAQFSTNYDNVQIGFYGAMTQINPPGGACPIVPLDWNQQMLASLNSYAATVPNYRHYLAAGGYHTLMRSPQFYAEASAGLRYADWVGTMLANRGGTNGQGGGNWKNVACPGCLVAPTCP